MFMSKCDSRETFTYRSREIRSSLPQRKSQRLVPARAKSVMSSYTTNPSIEHAQSRIHSFRESPKKIQKSKYQKGIEDQQELLRNELLLNNQHLLLRELKGERKNSDVKPKSSQAARSFERLAHNLKTSRVNPEGKLMRNDVNSKAQVSVHKPGIANIMVEQAKNEKWNVKHNPEQVKARGSKIKEIAKYIFDGLDLDMSETLEGQELITSLVGLGIAENHDMIRKNLETIFNTKSIDEISINCTEFLQLFQADKMTNQVLKILNAACMNKRKQHLNIKAGMMSVFKPSSFTAQNFAEMKTKPHTIAEYEEILDKWWFDIARAIGEEIPVERFVKKLLDIGVEGERSKIRKVVLTYNDGAERVSRFSFNRLFSRSILKGALNDLHKRIEMGPYMDKNIPPGIKVSAFRRRLIMSGLKHHSQEISREEGHSVLKAIRHYRAKSDMDEEDEDEEAYRKRVGMMLLNLNDGDLYDQMMYRKKLQIYSQKKIQEEEVQRQKEMMQALADYNDKNEQILEKESKVTFEPRDAVHLKRPTAPPEVVLSHQKALTKMVIDREDLDKAQEMDKSIRVPEKFVQTKVEPQKSSSATPSFSDNTSYLPSESDIAEDIPPTPPPKKEMRRRHGMTSQNLNKLSGRHDPSFMESLPHQVDAQNPRPSRRNAVVNLISQAVHKKTRNVRRATQKESIEFMPPPKILSAKEKRAIEENEICRKFGELVDRLPGGIDVNKDGNTTDPTANTFLKNLTRKI